MKALFSNNAVIVLALDDHILLSGCECNKGFEENVTAVGRVRHDNQSTDVLRVG